MSSNYLRDIDWQLLFIRSYNWTMFTFLLVKNQTVKSLKYLMDSFGSDIYCFFKGSSVPVRQRDYTNDVAGSAAVDFYYNRDDKVFLKNNELEFIPRTLNIESAKINHGDITLYDLTDFFDTTYYTGNEDIPNLNQWIGAWELENGIYLDRATDFVVDIDFLTGVKESFHLWNNTIGRWKELTSTPRLHRQVIQSVAEPSNNDVQGSTGNTTTDDSEEKAKNE